MIEYTIGGKGFFDAPFFPGKAEIHADAVVLMAAAEKVEDIVPAAARCFSSPARRSHAFFMSAF